MSTTRLEIETLPDEYVSRDVLESQLPDGAPEFLCPVCGCPLHYQGSRNTAEGACPLDLSDLYDCAAGCGRFEYARRSHRAHRVE